MPKPLTGIANPHTPSRRPGFVSATSQEKTTYNASFVDTKCPFAYAPSPKSQCRENPPVSPTAVFRVMESADGIVFFKA
jgi:hypothetical protein